MVNHCSFCLYEAFAITLDEKALSPAARLLYDNAERISLSANDIEYDHPEASQNRLAYVILLDAVLTLPDAVIRGLRYVRDDMVKADLGARLSAAAEPGLAADGDLRPQDRAFLKSEFGSKAFPIYECAAAEAQAVRRL